MWRLSRNSGSLNFQCPRACSGVWWDSFTVGKTFLHHFFSLCWNQQSEYRVFYQLMGWLHWMWYIFLLKLGHTRDWAWLLIHEVSRRTTVGRTPLDEWSARHRELYLTTHNTHNRQTSMPPVGIEPTAPAGERLQTYALDRAATGTGVCTM